MNVDQPSAGSVSTRNEVNAKAAKTTTKNQSRGRAERGRGAMRGPNSTAKAEMLFGLAFEGPRSIQSSGAFLHPWTTTALDSVVRVLLRVMPPAYRPEGSAESPQSCLPPPVRPVVDQRHGALDLRTQRDVGRVLRPSRGDRGRRAARLLHEADGRGRSDAVG